MTKRRSKGLTSSSNSVSHPGQYVRAKYLEPKGLSVSAAAALVGVGRPAFSNFLNGNAALTPDMAARLEVAFGATTEELLAMQSAFDATQAQTKGPPADATPYAVPFLDFKARDIENWAERNIGARSRLAVLIRTLVNSTGRSIIKVDFPGNDDAERPGWDGIVETGQGTPWVPEGVSGWEFGTNKDPKTKADGDIAKSVEAMPKADRENMTFVFVTPRHWPGKGDWERAQRAKKKWRDVRTYDSNDLEQWFEQSIAAQAWFAREIERPAKGVRTLAQCWDDWSLATDPVLDRTLFDLHVDAAKKTLTSRLTQSPGGPTIVAADSTDEALAFLAQCFASFEDPSAIGLADRALVFDEPGVVRPLAKATTTFIAIAHTRTVEAELAPLTRSHHCIVVYPRNAVNVEPHVTLEPLNYEAFAKPLKTMGFTRDQIARLANESGRSLTVLRRRLTTMPTIRTPHWAADAGRGALLVPFLWVGAWNATNRADQAVLELMSDEHPYDVLERQCQDLVRLDDPPLWSVGHYRGVISAIDALFAIAPRITASDLERFFKVAHIVLGEDDPGLDLPEDSRWAANIYGKRREFSATLRQGIAEALVLLAVHGNHLFGSRLAFDCEHEAGTLVRTLLMPLSTRLLEANDHDLTAYAEAAPEVFLAILEDDLKSGAPATYGLMRPAVGGAFGGCPRTGLLWALEGLAWSPITMPRVARILAQLSRIEINDNWVNKPMNSLESIFSAWMPQTAADHPTRLRALKDLAVRYPEIAWRLCIAQLEPGPRSGSGSHKPKWRNDGMGYGEPLPTWEPIIAFTRDMVEMVLTWKSDYTGAMICDLVSCLPGLSEEDRDRIWKIMTAWANLAPDNEKARVREHIRQRILSRRSKRHTNPDDYVALTDAAKAARQALEPTDIVQKHAWLFREHWLTESAEDLVDTDRYFDKRAEHVAALRAEALRDVYATCGVAGVLELSTQGNAAFVAGLLLAERVLSRAEVADVICAALDPTDALNAGSRQNLIAGLVRSDADEAKRQALLDVVSERLSEDKFVRVLLAAPSRPATWQRVDGLSADSRERYWRDVAPEGFREEDTAVVEAIERLVAFKRPRAAFHAAHFALRRLEPELVFRLMTNVAQGGDEQEGHYQLRHHYIEDAFDRINAPSSLTIEQKAGLEFAFIDALVQPGARGGIPNLERYVEAHPNLFVQALAWAYRRRGDGIDPPEIVPPDRGEKQLAERGGKLLRALRSIPGCDQGGSGDAARLRAWIDAVRDAAAQIDRAAVADVSIGELLSNAPSDDDGIWPCGPVREVIEDIQSVDMVRGMRTGRYNARGVHWRGEGGAQERALADKYRTWAEALQHSHPFVSSKLLIGLVKTYEAEAEREDTEATIQRRLRLG
jgi:addiction module HigA family antidote